MKNDRLVTIVAVLGFVAIGFYLYRHTGTGRACPGLVAPHHPLPGMQRAQVTEDTAIARSDPRPAPTQEVEPAPAGSPTAQPGPANNDVESMPGVEHVEGTGDGTPGAAALPGIVEKVDRSTMPQQGLFGGGTTTVELSLDC